MRLVKNIFLLCLLFSSVLSFAELHVVQIDLNHEEMESSACLTIGERSFFKATRSSETINENSTDDQIDGFVVYYSINESDIVELFTRHFGSSDNLIFSWIPEVESGEIELLFQSINSDNQGVGWYSRNFCVLESGEIEPVSSNDKTNVETSILDMTLHKVENFVDHELLFKMPITGDFSISYFNEGGVLMHRENFRVDWVEQLISITQVAQLNPGSYFCRIHSDKNEYQFKFVKY